jgi:hypothetical protein
MAVKTRNVLPADPIATDKLVIPIITAISQAGVVCYKYQPAYDYRIVRVRSYNLLKAGTVTYAVLVGARTVLTGGVFTSATEVAGTISATLANIVATSAEAITVTYTTDGSGVLTNGFVTIDFRPQHMNGES